MIYICVAFKEEAKPILQQWSFRRDKRAPCALYVNEHIYLCVTQMGQERALRALEALLQYRPPQQGDCFVNFGICAAPKSYALGEVLQCNYLIYGEQSLRLDADTASITLQMHDVPCRSEQPHAVDMESFALFDKALPLFLRCYCIKIVSDHFEPESINKETIITLLHRGVATLKEIIDENCCCHRS